MTLAEVSKPLVVSRIEEALSKGYREGVIGIRAAPAWADSTAFQHKDRSVRVVPCVSTLAVREALLDRRDREWLVIVTDRPDDDLGAGVLTHVLGHRLRPPDPWQALRHRFAATEIDPALATTGARELATGLLAATPTTPPPAPAGILTRDHAFAVVGTTHLGLDDTDRDFESVLVWTTDPATAALVADLRTLAGDQVTDATLTWLAQQAGLVHSPILSLLRNGNAADAVPLGLVVGVLTAALSVGPSSVADAAATAERHQRAREALIRLESRLGGQQPEAAVLQSWAAEAGRVMDRLLDRDHTRPRADRLLARADDLLSSCRAEEMAGLSDVVPAGLSRRLDDLATALQAKPATGAIERAWSLVVRHRLRSRDDRVRPFHAAVRLTRWLAVQSGEQPRESDLAALIRRHADEDAWVDTAVNDAYPGVSDAGHGEVLATVLATVRSRRHTHDLAFARALANHTADDQSLTASGPMGLWHLEDVLPQVVLPLARQTAVLLLVLDGMSAGVGTEVIAGVIDRITDGWVEALPRGRSRRGAAVAVLPTLTHVSRASLLCGQLCTGGQDVEQSGHAALAAAHGLASAALFHKGRLDSSLPGYALAEDVAAVIDDATGKPLVSCVLNTVDDALDRSDPGGTDWGPEVIKHLKPLLDRARRAGRIVVLTADHGHVVERREGRMQAYPGISSGRSRPATGPDGAPAPLGDGEVLISGQRVLEHGGRAILAVDERLRYGPLKAGYHGGAAPAEVVVPVAFLVPGAIPEGVDLELAPPQEPGWWHSPVSSAPPLVATPTPVKARAARATRRPEPDPSALLFDFDTPPVALLAEPTATGASVFASLADDVLRSPVFAAQRTIAARVKTTDDKLRALLTALLGASGNRLAPTQAALALNVPVIALRGEILHAQQLLNVESYPVLHLDADGVTVVLDEQLLREQFEVAS
ncbi:MAG: BREX-2 system phosphatase PglZ [Kineosporiaceae bacterium]